MNHKQRNCSHSRTQLNLTYLHFLEVIVIRVSNHITTLVKLFCAFFAFASLSHVRNYFVLKVVQSRVN